MDIRCTPSFDEYLHCGYYVGFQIRTRIFWWGPIVLVLFFLVLYWGAFCDAIGAADFFLVCCTFSLFSHECDCFLLRSRLFLLFLAGVCSLGGPTLYLFGLPISSWSLLAESMEIMFLIINCIMLCILVFHVLTAPAVTSSIPPTPVVSIVSIQQTMRDPLLVASSNDNDDSSSMWMKGSSYGARTQDSHDHDWKEQQQQPQTSVTDSRPSSHPPPHSTSPSPTVSDSTETTTTTTTSSSSSSLFSSSSSSSSSSRLTSSSSFSFASFLFPHPVVPTPSSSSRIGDGHSVSSSFQLQQPPSMRSFRIDFKTVDQNSGDCGLVLPCCSYSMFYSVFNFFPIG